LLLPFADSTVEVARSRFTWFAEKGRNPISSYRILVVDDEFLIRWSLTNALSQEGHEVISVEDGKKAIEAARAQPFDFVITDLVMPELDGWKVLEVLRQIQPASRVIILTAHGKEDGERMAKERGAWAYLEKPYVIDQIKKILRNPPKPGQNQDKDCPPAKDMLD
jgi:DNA-binding NtrC family response regulator